ncbi:MAG: EMC3/TMCO1 family protein [Candidatus Kariarchaeaceae archaeon]|jgi:uncharacterized membrane protein (DUF106 family)
MGIFDFLKPFQDAISDFLISTGLTVPAASTLLLLAVSLIVSTISGFVNRTLLDMEKISKQMEEMQEHQRKKKKAMETADKKLWHSVKRNETRFTELQKSTMTSRMLPSLLTIGPFIFIFQTLRGTFQKDDNLILNGRAKIWGGGCSNSCGVVAVLPFKISREVPLIGNWFSHYQPDSSLSVAGFGFWYFLSAIVISTLIQRLFGINITGMQNPMQQQR